MGVSCQPHTQGKSPPYPFGGRLGGPQDWSERSGEKSLPPPEIKPKFPAHNIFTIVTALSQPQHSLILLYQMHQLHNAEEKMVDNYDTWYGTFLLSNIHNKQHHTISKM
jgi:hypothetical protein